MSHHQKQVRRQVPPRHRGKATLWLITLLGFALAIVANSLFGAPLVVLQSPATSVAEADRGASAGVAPDPPPALQTILEEFATSVPGKNAVLVRSIDYRWVAGYRGATLFPQGSLRRLWLAAAVLEAAGRGEISLDQRLVLPSMKSQDPARTQVLSTLLQQAISKGDYGAQDELLAGLMGPTGMTAWLARHGFDEVAFGPFNRDLTDVRRPSQHHVAPDGATPDGLAVAVGELFAGNLLKPPTREFLFRLLAPLPRSDRPSTKTVVQLSGSSVQPGPETSAGGVALIRATSGARFVVVVFAAESSAPARYCDVLMTKSIAAVGRL